MEMALTRARIPVVNIRYGALDPVVKAFDPRVTLMQWRVFGISGRLISDAEARMIIGHERLEKNRRGCGAFSDHGEFVSGRVVSR